MRRLGLAAFLFACGAPAAPATAAPTAPTARAWESIANGCSDVFLFVGDASKTRYLVVQTGRAALGLEKPGDAGSIDLAHEPNAARVEVYPRAGGAEHYCTDVEPADPPRSAETWRAVGGKLTFVLGPIREADTFEITMKLEGVTVRRTDGAIERIPDTTYTTTVGWLPG